ncbi:hypothetical protein Vadar_019725 [Vaccinium darrowii]|uniref:Uncharacterized protein n=1 Tax=Vaccinium darrowii TaxID=229202 RepID=A0ACB7XRY8_9ERIC|nr:hypothetical protein Vadar_019725 [Vaccinium darrowii]
MVTNSRVVSEKGGWIPVGNKRINRVEAMNNTRVQFNNGNGPLFTLFIDNLPEDASNSWLKEFFSNYGVVIGTFIPEKRSKATGRKFGFVRYNCSVSADVAISKAHGLWCKDMKLFVKYASFTPYRHGNQINLNEGYSKGVDVVLSRGNNLDKGAIFNTLDASNKSFGQGPRKTFAQALCGDTSNLGVQKDQSITLIINPVGNEWLQRSAVAVMHNVVSMQSLKASFKLETDAIGSINSTEKDVKDDFILKEIIPSEASEDDDKEDDVDALVGEKLQENSTDQVSSVGSKMDEEYEDVIPINKDTFMVPDSFGRKTEDSLSNCDSLIGDSSEDIESFEDTATARQLGNILEDIEEVADTEVGMNKKTDESEGKSRKI